MSNLTLSLISAILIGLGFAASKTSNPMQARIRSLMNHTAFPGTARQGRCDAGLYLFALLVNWLIWTPSLT
ncbi:MAG: hypothetical protein ACXW4Q_12925 [Anaerolineales bacterium]